MDFPQYRSDIIFGESTDTQEDINGQEFYYESVVDLYANFGAVSILME